MSVQILRPVGRPSVEQKMVEATLVSSVIDFKKWIKANNRVATGNALNSFKVLIKKTFKNLIITGEIKAVSYMNYVLFGRKPGSMPDRRVILQWMRSKNISSPLYSQRDLSYLIARKIGERGTLPPHLTTNIRARMVKLNTKSVIRKSRKYYVQEKSKEFMSELREQFKVANARNKNVQLNVLGSTRIKEFPLNAIIDNRYDLNKT